MNAYSWLVVYSLLVVLGSLVGGYVPFLTRLTHNKIQFYLSLSAGVMLGASFFHVMPDAMEMAGHWSFGWWMSLGVVGLFCIERFIAPHSHEVDDGHHHHEKEHNHLEHHEHGHHYHDHDDPAATAKEHGAAAPPVAGWMAVLGLTIHTFMNGVALAGAVQAAIILNEPGAKAVGLLAALPGLAMFLAIVLHKPMDALAISTVLTRKGVSRQMISLVQFGFAAMVPIGAVAFFLLGSALTKSLENELTGAALAFSAGTFLFIALSDLLPEVQFHRHDRIPLFLTLAVGVVFMGFIAFLEGQGGNGAHSHGSHVTHSSHDSGHNGDHDDDHDHHD
jgi:zinc and cadmium transporter